MDNEEHIKRAHKKLDVWKESASLATDIYKVTDSFPKEEVYGLVSQKRGAAVSVPSNIAEGAAHNSNKEFARFLNVAGGSLSELGTQLEITSTLDTCQKKLNRKLINRLQLFPSNALGC